MPRSAQNWPWASCPDSPNVNPMDYHVFGAMLEAYRKLKKAENKCQTQGNASGYLGQPATGTDQQDCERFLK